MYHLVPGRNMRNRVPIYAVVALAVALLVLGVPLFVGGVWLMILTGGLFFMLAGAGLCLTAYFLFQKSVIAIWVYLLTFAGTLYWTLSSADDWAAQIPWLIAATVILLLLLFTLPVLTGAERQKQRPTPKLVLFIGGTLALWNVTLQEEIGLAIAACNLGLCLS